MKQIQKHQSQELLQVLKGGSIIGMLNQKGVHAVETLLFIHSKELSDTTVSWKDHAYSVLEFEGNFAHGLHATQGSSN
jgi:hypothetical protein